MDKLSKTMLWVSNRFNSTHSLFKKLSDEQIKAGIEAFIEDNKEKSSNNIYYLFIGGGELISVGTYKSLQKEVLDTYTQAAKDVKDVTSAVKSGDANKINSAIDKIGQGAKVFGKPVFADGKVNPEFESMFKVPEEASLDALRKLSKQDLLSITETGIINTFRIMFKEGKLLNNLDELRKTVEGVKTDAEAEAKAAVTGAKNYADFVRNLINVYVKMDIAFGKLFNTIENRAKGKTEEAK